MLGAQINVVEASIRNVNALPDKYRRQLWLKEIKRVDWTETIVKHDCICSSHFLSEKVE